MRNFNKFIPQKKYFVVHLLVIYFLITFSYYVAFSNRKLSWRDYIALGNDTSSYIENLKEKFNEQFNVLFNHELEDVKVDLHLFDMDLGHTGETWGHDDQGNAIPVIAIGLGITSNKVHDVTAENLDEKFVFHSTFLPTFCATISPGFRYAFYMGFDYNDVYFSNMTFLTLFQRTFNKVISRLCPSGSLVSLHFVQCDHHRKPAWAQNDAMLEAYLDNVDYHYRINDDTKIGSANWADLLVGGLAKYNPKNVGVVGPTHRGGNQDILTYDFVHSSHIDVFGFYYPRLITDWWADDWVSTVYLPGRMTKLQNVTLHHTLSMGQRYYVNWAVGHTWLAQMLSDRKTVQRYLQYRMAENQTVDYHKSRVISMSLFGRDPVFTWGAIRNAQLAPVHFPGWVLRFYTLDPAMQDFEIKSNWTVPRRILQKLEKLGAEIIYLDSVDLIPEFWRYLVIDDVTVEYFIIRDVTGRLSDRDYSVVNEWIDERIDAEKMEGTKTQKFGMHCVRDHPRHENHSVVEGLWGGKRVVIREALENKNIKSVIMQHLNLSNGDQVISEWVTYKNSNLSQTNDTSLFRKFPAEVLWTKLSKEMRCHDSVSCTKWTGAVLFKTRRLGARYLGEKFNEHQEVIDRGIFFPNRTDSACNPDQQNNTTAATVKL